MSNGDIIENSQPAESGANGFALIKSQLPRLPTSPGVYRMLNEKGDPLYVGKARNLRKRVTTYSQPQRLNDRLMRMVAQTASLEVIVTHTEAEALLLESNLIKQMKPRYNILLRDDKSFPFILVTADHEFAQITKHRGARTRAGRYYGPFASGWAVNNTMAALARAFPLRNCSDADFATRTRPCLQYQIKRCSAPCVGRINRQDYANIVQEAQDFLEGRNKKVMDALHTRMAAASARQDYEMAAGLRDRVRALAHITQHQDINIEGLGDADVIAVHREGGQACVQIFFYRAGQNYGNRAYYPVHAQDADEAAILDAFIGQFYVTRPPPPLILLSHDIAELQLLGDALKLRAGHKVEITAPRKGAKRAIIEHALRNAREALVRRLSETAAQESLLEEIGNLFGMVTAPRRIEIYDNSHIQGRNAVGAMVAAGPEGFIKSAYRQFNIRLAGADETNPDMPRGGDDYAMMREVLMRRFSRLVREDPERRGESWPDLILIDGGKGQLNAARAILNELGLLDICTVGISKGPDRNAGREQIHLPDHEPFTLEPNDARLYFLQRLRDEAHRFAIGTHRARRAKGMAKSQLDEIPGVGGARKKALLERFGSAAGVRQAGLTDLETVPGINKAVAKRIYDYFHE